MQMKFSRVLLALSIPVILLLLPSHAAAGIVEVTGTVTLPYKGKSFSSMPSGSDKNAALREAKLQTWEVYTAKFSDAKMRQYLPVKSVFINDIDSYVLNVSVLDEEIDKKAKIMTVVVISSINETAVDATLGSMSAAGNGATGDGSGFTFVFVARQAISSKTKDAKRIDITQVEGAYTADESLTANNSGANSSGSYNSVTKSTSGGSTERTATTRQYQVISSQDIDSAMSNVLATAGFEIINYEDVVDECGGTEPEDIREEYRAQDDMSRESRKEAIAGTRDCDVPLFATGTIDVGVQDTDPKTGNQRVFVSVRGQVWNVEGRLPKKVAAVGPVQYSGLGPDDSVAMRNALNLAGREAAKSIVEQLNAKGIF